jgi:hypothetical protein
MEVSMEVSRNPKDMYSIIFPLILSLIILGKAYGFIFLDILKKPPAPSALCRGTTYTVDANRVTKKITRCTRVFFLIFFLRGPGRSCVVCASIARGFKCVKFAHPKSALKKICCVIFLAVSHTTCDLWLNWGFPAPPPFCRGTKYAVDCYHGHHMWCM